VLILSLLSISPSTYAQEMNEQQILTLFMQQNLALMAAKSQVDMATAQVVIAKELTNPTVSLSVAGLGDTKDWEGGNSYWDKPFNNNLSISQLIETAGKRQLRIEGADIGLSAQSLLFTDLVRSLKRDLLNTYYAVVMNQRRVRIYDEILVQLNGMLTANALRWKAGDISETEFRRIELEVFKAKTDVEQAHLDLDLSRQQLNEMLAHGLQWESLTVNDDFPVRQLPSLKQQQLLDSALAQRADVQAAALAVQQQDTQLRFAEALKVPDLTVGVQYVHDASAFLRDSAGVGVSLSVPLWHQYQGEVEQARASKRGAEVAFEQLKKQVQTQVGLSFAEFRQKKQVLQRFDQDVISRAKQVQASSALAYRQGAISLLELLDAENNYRNTMLSYTQALYDQTAAWFNLMYAMGEDGK
jgi:cobalt-zinc-cadmium efflux system outer membrane protein